MRRSGACSVSGLALSGGLTRKEKAARTQAVGRLQVGNLDEVVSRSNQTESDFSHEQPYLVDAGFHVHRSRRHESLLERGLKGLRLQVKLQRIREAINGAPGRVQNETYLLETAVITSFGLD